MDLTKLISAENTKTENWHNDTFICIDIDKDSCEVYYTHLLCLLLLIELYMLSILLWNFSFVVKLVQSTLLASLVLTFAKDGL